MSDSGGIDLSSGSAPVSQIEAELNFLEQVDAALGTSDDYLAAIVETNRALLRSNQRILQQTRQEGMMNGSMTNTENDDGGIFTVPEEGSLPEDAVGMVTRDTGPNDHGPAVFRINGTQFFARVQNADNETHQAGTPVRVVGDGNAVTSNGAGGSLELAGGGEDSRYFRYQGRLYHVPQVLTDDADVKVSNQKYVRGEYQSVDGSLGAGETKEIARIEPEPDSFFLLKHINATNHDTVQYNYYIDTDTSRDDDLSGATPWAMPPDLYEVVPGGWRLVEDHVSVEMEETSGGTKYNTVQATLTGIRIEV